MNRPAVFRQNALKQLSSPEDLDGLLRVTDPRGWLVLVGMSLLVATALVWGVEATVPMEVGGQGILLKSGGIFEVVALTNNRVLDVAVDVGDLVREGQVVARMEQPELAEKVRQGKNTVAVRHADHQQLMSAGARETAFELESLAEQVKNVSDAIAGDEKSLDWQRERVANQQQLVSQGRLTRQALVASSQQLGSTLQRIKDRRHELTQLDLKKLQLQARRERDVQASTMALAEAEERLRQLERDLALATEVRSPVTGRILEVVAERGAVVSRGEPLLTLDLAGRMVTGLEAVLYVPARDGKRIRRGMFVKIAPATVRPEEYGYLVGTVAQVSDFPSTARGMIRVLKNKQLVDTLSGGSPPHEVRVDLLPDPSTVSTYRWSSSQGPPLHIQSGTLCSAWITFDSRRPIEMVLPFLRRTGI